MRSQDMAVSLKLSHEGWAPPRSAATRDLSAGGDLADRGGQCRLRQLERERVSDRPTEPGVGASRSCSSRAARRKTRPAVMTILAPSAFDQLRSDLEAIARASGGRVGISLQELSGPRRT